MPVRIASQIRTRAAHRAAAGFMLPPCIAAALVAALVTAPAFAKTTRGAHPHHHRSWTVRARKPASADAASEPDGATLAGTTSPSASTPILGEALASIEGTAPSLLAPSLPSTVEDNAAEPSLADDGEQLVAAGSLTSSTVSKQGGTEFAVETAEGEVPIRLLGAPGDALAPVLVNGTAALLASSSDSIAAVMRPSPFGMNASVVLDSPAAPHSISWEVRLHPGQRLVALPDGRAAVLGDGPSDSLEQSPSGQPLELAARHLSVAASGSTTAIATAPSSSSAATTAAAGSIAPVATLTTPPAPVRAGEAQPQQTGDAYAAELAALRRSESQTSEADMLLTIEAATGSGAAGEALSAKLSVSGDELTLTIDAPEDAAYPLVATMPVIAPSDAVSSERHHAVYGLADDRPASFGAGLSAQLREGPLRVGVARLVIPYEVALSGGPELTRLREWLHAVGETRDAAGAPLQPYITLWSEGCLDRDGEGCTPPPAARYREAVAALMRDYGDGEPSEGLPPVKLWGAWNEPNDSEARFPASAAGELWQIANAVSAEVACGCEVAAGEFAGFPSAYAAAYKTYMLERGLAPGVWAMHDYGDLLEVPSRSEAPLSSYVNRRVQEMLTLTSSGLRKPRIWLSEQGVELENTGGATRLLASAELQSLAAEDFLRLAGESTRIQLVDYYMQGAPEGFSETDGYYRAHPETEGIPVFDSSLFTESGLPTSALCVLGYESHTCPAGS